MSGPKKVTVKLSEQGVVTEEAMIAYIQNKLSPEEKQQVEKLLQADPFAQDALEGLQASASQTTVTTSITSLNKKVRERSGLKEQKGLKMHWVSYAWAAVVFGLVVGIAFILVNFLNKHDNNTLALNEKKDVPAAPLLQTKDTVAVVAIPKIDSVATTVSLTDTLAGTVASAANAAPVSAFTTNEKSKNDKDAIVTVTAAAKTAGTNDGKATAMAGSKAADNTARKEEKQPAAKLKPKNDSTALANYTIDRKLQAPKPEAAKKESKPEIKDMGALQDDAMKNFNAADYNTAADDFEKILKHDPDNVDALYFGGISDYINGKTTKSENNFDRLLKKGNKYIEGSKWYKANILIKKGRSEAAKSILQDLSNSGGSYKERAIKKLAEMGF